MKCEQQIKKRNYIENVELCAHVRRYLSARFCNECAHPRICLPIVLDFFFFQNDKPNKLRRICYARIIITIDLIECFNNKKTVWDEIKSTRQSDNFHAR